MTTASETNLAAPLASVLVQLNAEQLRPLIATVVAEVLRQLDADQHRLNGDVLAYDEPTAARLLGLEEHVLRDERRRKRITASKIVGRRVRYQKADLIAYLAERRVNGGGTGHSS